MYRQITRKIFISILMSLLAYSGLSGCDDSLVEYDYTITWTMDNSSPSLNSVFLAVASSEPDELVLAVDANSITNGLTHGVYFDLVFRDEVLYFDGYTKGSLLEEAGSVVYSVALDPHDSGRLIVGVSLIGDLAIEEANGALIYLRFKPFRSGTCPIGFENSRVMTALDGGTYPVTGVSWYGGYATIIK